MLTRPIADARRGTAPATQGVSTLLVRTPLERKFKDSEGRWLTLPDEISDDEFYRTQTEVKAAEQRLGKGPPPKPVLSVKKDAGKKEQKKEEPSDGRKARPGPAGKGAAAAGAAAMAALKVVGTSKVVMYLVAKAASVLGKGIGMLGKLRQNEQTHDNAAQKRQQSEQAVVIPDSENQSKSNDAQVGAVGARPAPPVDKTKGQNELQESLKRNIPKKISRATCPTNCRRSIASWRRRRGGGDQGAHGVVGLGAEQPCARGEDTSQVPRSPGCRSQGVGRGHAIQHRARSRAPAPAGGRQDHGARANGLIAPSHLP
jgi:hypothetical protein